MKLKFDANLEYQEQAVSSVVNLFKGQTPKKSNFTVAFHDMQVDMFSSNNGIGNKLELIEEEILENLHEVQLRNGLPESKALRKGDYDFDIEMETGTGKTYVYLRTIFELNKAYGFTKFIIVVPSIAIKEGVAKTIEITREHFGMLYNHVPYDAFVYDSSNLEQVRSFATSDSIQIMVINIDAFRKSFVEPKKENKSNIIHRPTEILNWSKPIVLILETRPIVIIDEPQSVDTTPMSKVAIAGLNPLCTLRYSATHVDKHNLIYKLDAVDAFDMELVKQIEVVSFESLNYHNADYMRLVSVDNTKTPITAKIELDCEQKGKVKRKTVTVKKGDELSDKKLGNRTIYEPYKIDEIYCEKGKEFVAFAANDRVLHIGQVFGDVDDDALKEQQIRKTIEEHLDKELVLNKQGIKVLSLFFIDKVKNYRYYDTEGKRHAGKYAKMFERQYQELVNLPKYHTLFENIQDVSVEKVHDGYFSVDKKVKTKNGEKAFTDTSGSTAADDDTYSLIMRDKEKLLSLDNELRFIFSHSALREGWDNPNVFQICTLNESRSEVKKRQEIGRGLRLCVNQKGERQHGFSINTLTVMANESYEDFAEKLQKEYEDEEGIRFGIIESHTFANIPIRDAHGEIEYLGAKKSNLIYQDFLAKGYVDSKNQVTDLLREDLKNNTLSVAEEVFEYKASIEAVCRKVSGKLNIKPAKEKREVCLNKQRFLGDDFRELWDKIKYKTTYAVYFDTEKLIERCCRMLQESLDVNSAKLRITKAKVNVTVGGVNTSETLRTTAETGNVKIALPDIVTYLQNRTNLMRKTIVRILIESRTLELFKRNPQNYMESAAKLISAVMRDFIVDGIKYTKLGDSEYYAQELFEVEELTGYLEYNMMESERSIYNYVVYDSENERRFAEGLEHNDKIKVYAKLPSWFKISTPLGGYNPDWAVLVEDNGQNKLYFVVETKGNIMFDALRSSERDKFTCGAKHFEALGNGTQFIPTDSYEGFIEKI